MARLIDADAACDRCRIKNAGNCGYCIIGTAPIVDAIEVVHGYWNISKESFDECSVCGTACGIAEYDKFCPNCGAKMDGGAENGEVN